MTSGPINSAAQDSVRIKLAGSAQPVYASLAAYDDVVKSSGPALEYVDEDGDSIVVGSSSELSERVKEVAETQASNETVAEFSKHEPANMSFIKPRQSDEFSEHLIEAFESILNTVESMPKSTAHSSGPAQVTVQRPLDIGDDDGLYSLGPARTQDLVTGEETSSLYSAADSLSGSTPTEAIVESIRSAMQDLQHAAHISSPHATPRFEMDPDLPDHVAVLVRRIVRQLSANLAAVHPSPSESCNKTSEESMDQVMSSLKSFADQVGQIATLTNGSKSVVDSNSNTSTSSETVRIARDNTQAATDRLQNSLRQFINQYKDYQQSHPDSVRSEARSDASTDADFASQIDSLTPTTKARSAASPETPTPSAPPSLVSSIATVSDNLSSVATVTLDNFSIITPTIASRTDTQISNQSLATPTIASQSETHFTDDFDTGSDDETSTLRNGIRGVPIIPSNVPQLPQKIPIMPGDAVSPTFATGPWSNSGGNSSYQRTGSMSSIPAKALESPSVAIEQPLAASVLPSAPPVSSTPPAPGSVQSASTFGPVSWHMSMSESSVPTSRPQYIDRAAAEELGSSSAWDEVASVVNGHSAPTLVDGVREMQIADESLEAEAAMYYNDEENERQSRGFTAGSQQDYSWGRFAVREEERRLRSSSRDRTSNVYAGHHPRAQAEIENVAPSQDPLATPTLSRTTSFADAPGMPPSAAKILQTGGFAEEVSEFVGNRRQSSSSVYSDTPSYKSATPSVSRQREKNESGKRGHGPVYVTGQDLSSLTQRIRAARSANQAANSSAAARGRPSMPPRTNNYIEMRALSPDAQDKADINRLGLENEATDAEKACATNLVELELISSDNMALAIYYAQQAKGDIVDAIDLLEADLKDSRQYEERHNSESQATISSPISEVPELVSTVATE
ncbi:uncharacterized protein V1516DRAFT_489213 [Lipomyces oligophaga]|uniref:uncharacterized protein n=1 Tax=Lipomyces oligophaga TaxID=45792 RepID=UPI0034CFC1F4